MYLCDDLGLDRKNPELGDPPSNWKRFKAKESKKRRRKYTGVSWNSQKQKWRAAIRGETVGLKFGGQPLLGIRCGPCSKCND
eukprot:UN14955